MHVLVVSQRRESPSYERFILIFMHLALCSYYYVPKVSYPDRAKDVVLKHQNEFQLKQLMFKQIHLLITLKMKIMQLILRIKKQTQHVNILSVTFR